MTIRGYNVKLGGQRMNDTLLPGPPFTIEGLNSDSAYNVTVSTVDMAGFEGPDTPIYPFRTLPLAPANTGPLSDAQAAAVDAIVLADMAKNKQPGTIVQITGPAGSYVKAYGKTSVVGRQVSIDDHVRIGSNTKIFIAMAAMLELDKKSFALSDKISQYVPNVTTGDKITIDNLLTMRSGLTDFWSWNNPYIMFLLGVFQSGPFSAQDCENAARSSPSKFEPGTAFDYSNSNAVVAGMLVEAVSGMRIRDYLIERIIKPLGLTETTWPSNAGLPQPGMSGSSFNPEIAGAAGCLTSTIGDMTKFAKEMRDGTLLSDETHSYWMNTFYDIGSNTLYTPPPATLGYGNFMFKFGRWIGHGGSIPTGFDSGILYDPASGATICVVNNAQIGVCPGFYSVSHDIAALLYPGSMNQPSFDYRPKQSVFPKTRELKIVGGVPGVTVGPRNPSISPAPAQLVITGGVPGANTPAPAPAALTIVGGVPVVTIGGPPLPFDAAGTGTSSSGGNWSWTHTAAEGAYVLCFVVSDRANPIGAVSYGGVLMKFLGTVTNGGRPDGGYGTVDVYGLPGVPGGTSAVVVGSPNNANCLANTYSYNGAATAEVVGTASGNGQPMVQQVPCVSPQRAVQVFGNSSAGLFPGAGPLTPAGGTNRGALALSGSVSMTVSDAVATTDFSAQSGSTYWWGAIGVVLKPGRLTKPVPAALTVIGGVPVIETPVKVAPASAQAVINSLPPEVSVVPVFGFDASSVSPQGYTASLSWTHTTKAGCYAIVDLAMGEVNTVVKYDGVQMDLLGYVRFNNGAGGQGILRRYGLPNVPGGSKTITVQSADYRQHQAACVTYRGVSSIVTDQGSFGQGGDLALAADIRTGKLLVQSFAGYGAAGRPLTNLQGGVNRVNVNGGTRMSISESDQSVTFTANDTQGIPWSAVASVIS